MAFEALSHAGGIKSNLLVVLNDNEMSISPNVGAVHKYLTRILTGKTFNSIKEGGKKVFSKVKAIEEIAKRVENQAKGFITPGLLFEELGFKYYGPVDGHDVTGLIEVLSNLKDKEGPRILHIITKKGKGYKLAEQNPISYHGVTPFDVKTGVSKKNKLDIKYIHASPEKLKIKKKFDVILNMEIVEHVEDINFFINSCSKLLKKNGLMFVATLNKTLKSYLFAIIGAEYILRWLPIGTHEWEKFVKPKDLIDILKKYNFELSSLDGMKFNPIKDEWSLSSDKSINYIGKFKKN